MAEAEWVLNASPVIVLAKVGALGLLEALASRVLVPEAVAAEVLAGPEADPGRTAVTGGWGQRVPHPAHVPKAVVEWGLGAGETAVLATALE